VIERMTKTEIQEIQYEVGAKPDGIWGPRSRTACQRHLQALMPKPSPWPHPDHSELEDFYDDPWDNTNIVGVTAPPWLRLYGTDRRVSKIYCHVEVAHSLLRALEAAYEVEPDVVSRYFGCHVDRNTRGGSSPSLHAYGAAIDLAAHTNQNHAAWPTKSDMPLSVMEAFAREGWTAAGAFWGRDAMHFQATQPT